jgi:LysR family transcriptional regulator (chromosome initiation inhibitor)
VVLLKHQMLPPAAGDLEPGRLKGLAPQLLGGAREEERGSIAISADSIASWALPR